MCCSCYCCCWYYCNQTVVQTQDDVDDNDFPEQQPLRATANETADEGFRIPFHYKFNNTKMLELILTLLQVCLLPLEMSENRGPGW